MLFVCCVSKKLVSWVNEEKSLCAEMNSPCSAYFRKLTKTTYVQCNYLTMEPCTSTSTPLASLIATQSSAGSPVVSAGTTS